jgi:hypothetical protein
LARHCANALPGGGNDVLTGDAAALLGWRVRPVSR